MQDSNGFVWVGTDDGLNRYDGVSFRKYDKRELGLKTSFVVSLCADDEGNVWVGTDDGLTRYDYDTDRFEPFETVTAQGTAVRGKVSCILIGSDGVVWFSAGGEGLFRFNPDEGKLLHYFYDGDGLSLPAGITTFCLDDEGELWLSLYFTGLYHVDRTLREITEVKCDRDISSDYIVGVYRCPKDGRIIFASAGQGLCSLDPETGCTKTLIQTDTKDSPIGMFVDKDGSVWTASHHGLWKYDIIEGSVVRIEHDPSDRFSLSDNNVNAFMVDAQGGLWAGTANCGVDYSAPGQKKFRRFQTADTLPLEGAMLRSLSPDNSGRLWIATESLGIFSLDVESEEMSRVKDVYEWTSCLLCDGGSLWFGTHRGISRYDTESGRIRSYDWLSRDSHLRDNKIANIYRTSSGTVLCGSTLGLLAFNRDIDGFEPLSGFDGVFVRDIIEDKMGRLWVASYADGLFCYDLRSEKILGHWTADASGDFNIPSNKLNSVTVDSGGHIWVSSYSSGFFCINPADGSIRLYNTENNAAVSSDIVFSIVEDLRGYLWLSSNYGLMRLDPTSEEIITYTTRDGLLDDEFNFNSGTLLPNGMVVFGSRNGMVCFRPEDLDRGRSSVPVRFTDLRIGGQIVTPCESGSPLYENIDKASRIVLKRQQNSFSITLSMPTLLSPTDGSVSFRLKGFDDEWKTLYWTGKRRVLRWSNLPAGKYVLEVNVPGGSHNPLEIQVKRYPLLSLVAILIYFLLVAGIFAGLAIYLKNREKHRAEKVSFKDKMAFFTNIIHEIKTPLTLIKTPLQHIMARQGSNEDISEDLSLINDNANYMDRLVKEMLDFVRVEQNGYNLNLRTIDIVGKTASLVTRFQELARSKNIDVSFDSSEGRMVVDADDSALTKILNNLLDNAVKYAQTYIKVTLTSDAGQALVSIANDGPEIPRNRRSDIFKPFVQFSNEKAPYSQSFGVGLPFARSLARLHGGNLVLSPGTETQFVLSLPLAKVQELVEIPSPEDPETDDERPLILVVEDNADLQGYLRRKLLQNYRVVVSSSAERALEIVAQSDVDLIVSDIALEGMSGIELCRKINSDFEHSHIVVVMLSALSNPSIKIEALENGAALYIEKPFDLDYLLSSVSVLLERRKTLRNAFLNGSQPDYSSFCLPGSDEAFLRKLDKVIMENISDSTLSNEQICEAMSMSRSTLIRKVKGLLDTTPNDYIRLKRLSVAARLLESNSVRISEVCYSVGFNTPSYFSKCFKAQYGMLPNEYAKEYSQTNI